MRHSFEHDGIQRAYRIHLPSSYDGNKPLPLLFCFHGGGGNAEVASVMGFTPVSEKEGFIVVYPEGLNKHWNDGRNSKKFAAQDAKTDDVAFVSALLVSLQKKYKIDAQRIYTTGASNGGFFSQRLALEASDIFAAAAIMIATLPKPFEANFRPLQPISILYMNGTADPFVPYKGGPITPEFFPIQRKLNPNKDYQRGECSSTSKSIELWCAYNGVNKKPVVEALADKDPDDACTVEVSTWSGGQAGTSVVLYRIKGGGHTIPGGSSYLPERIIGKVCKDFDGIGAVWEFLEKQRRAVKAAE
ncbi:MAG: PHB depolymerase family esterase [Verrucomicrobiota bacterium]